MVGCVGRSVFGERGVDPADDGVHDGVADGGSLEARIDGARVHRRQAAVDIERRGPPDAQLHCVVERPVEVAKPGGEIVGEVGEALPLARGVDLDRDFEVASARGQLGHAVLALAVVEILEREALPQQLACRADLGEARTELGPRLCRQPAQIQAVCQAALKVVGDAEEPRVVLHRAQDAGELPSAGASVRERRAWRARQEFCERRSEVRAAGDGRLNDCGVVDVGRAARRQPPFTALLSREAALKLGAVIAVIWIVSPSAGHGYGALRARSLKTCRTH